MPVTLTTDLTIMDSRDDKRPASAVRVKTMPKALFMDGHERQALANHGQTLAALNARGGLSPTECLLVLACQPASSPILKLPHEDAHRLLYAIRVAFNRGGLVARGET